MASASPLQPPAPTTSTNTPSDHHDSPGSLTSLEVGDHAQNNPELYLLRRSERASNNPLRNMRNEISYAEDSDSDIAPARKYRKTRPSQNPASGSQSRRPSSQSEADTFGGARVRAPTNKNRRLRPGSSTPPLGDVRFSTRRAAKVATYNESGSEDEFAEDPDSLTPNTWQESNEDSPVIDSILTHRTAVGTSTEVAKKEEYEYRIKWQNKSHYHSTWEPYSELAKLRGSKKVKNYFESIIREEHRIEHDVNVQPEDKEQFYLSREEKADELANFTVVERVIDVRPNDGESEYLVKWKGLLYDSCTWEFASLVSILSQKEIDRFLNRSSYFPTSNKTESNPATRSTYKPFRVQPSYIKNGELRDFQIEGINFLAHNWCKGNSVILADEMGLGKTVQTVAFMSWLRNERQQQGPFLVVVPLSTMRAWADTFDHWAPDLNYVVYSGRESARTTIRDMELFVDGNPRKTKFNVLLTTYEYVIKKEAWTPELSQIKWQFLAVDEAHRLKNKESQLYDKLMNLGAPSRLLITGTPVQNNLGELSALMNFLMPGEIILDEDIDLSSDAASEKIKQLTEEIRPYIIRRTKEKVEKDLPPKTEKIIRVELSDFQLEYYKNILTRNYTALNQGGSGYKLSLLNIMMELKKASNHPFLFPGAEEQLLRGTDTREEYLKACITSSGKMMLLDQLLTKLKKDGRRVLIFSQMVRMLDIIGEYLRLKGYQNQRIDGTVSGGARQLAMDHFNAPESKDFCFLLSTRAGGLGINLTSADTVILFDSDWNPQVDIQAFSRAHRIGQKNKVNIYRFVSKDTVEEVILERARNKLMLEFITIQRGVTDKDTSDLNKRLMEANRNLEGSPNDPDDINRILKRRGQKMFEQSGNQKRLEELDIDVVLENAEVHKTEQAEGLAADGGEEFLKSFQYTDVKVELEWDQIIPEERIANIKAEEKRKEEEIALAKIIEQNAPRKRNAPLTEYTEDREERAAKKRTRDQAAADTSEDDESDSALNLDPKRPMAQKETRNLIRAYEKFGHADDRQEDVMKEAKLVGRDIGVVQQTLNEVIAMGRKLLEDAEEERLVSIPDNEGKTSAKKNSEQTVIFAFNGVKRLNAKTIVERQDDMRLIRTVTYGVTDFRTFRIPGAMKPAGYSIEWGAREDGMLCIGVARHGHGSWAAIRDDPELEMSEKIFLEENQVARKEERNKAESKEKKAARTPGAVHLVRRTSYLIDVLKATTSNAADPAAQKAQKALENHHRNTKKPSIPARQLEKSSRPSSSPGPGKLLPKPNRESGKSHTQHPDSNDRRPLSKLKPSDRDRSDQLRSESRDEDRRKHTRDRSDDYLDPKSSKRPRTDERARESRDADLHRHRRDHSDDYLDPKGAKRPRPDERARESRDAERHKHFRDPSDDHLDPNRSKYARLSEGQKHHNRLDRPRSNDHGSENQSMDHEKHPRSNYGEQSDYTRRRSSADQKDHDRHLSRSDGYMAESRNTEHHKRPRDRSDYEERGDQKRQKTPDGQQRLSHHATDGHAHERVKSNDRATNGGPHHSSSNLGKDVTRQNGSNQHDGQQRKDKRDEHARAEDRVNKDVEMEAFFKPVTREIESLKGASKNSGNDPITRTKIIKDVLTAVGRYIAQHSLGKEELFEEKSWEYFAKNFWITKKQTGDALKKSFDNIVEKDQGDSAPQAPTSS